MVSLEIQLLLTILFLSEGYSQLNGCACGYNQRYGAPQPPPGPVIPACQFVVPAVIKPLISSCQCPAASQPANCPSGRQSSCASAPCADDECELDRMLYALISSIIDNRRCSGRRSGYNPSCNSFDGNSDYYGDRSPVYCDEYDNTQPSPYYTPPATPYSVCSNSDPYAVTTSCDNNNCPEICVTFKPCACHTSDCQ